MLRLIISSHCCAGGRYIAPPTCRCIYSTPHLSGSWMEKEGSSESYTLLQLAEKMREVRELGKWKDYMVVRDSEATFTEGFERKEAIIRYLGGIDPAGENIDINQKKEAAKQCNCTLANVESALSNFTLAKETQRKIKQLKAEGRQIDGIKPYGCCKIKVA